MTPDILRRCATAYGGSTRLADAVGAHDQDMRHYIAGRRDCPQWIVDKLPQVLAERAAELRAQAEACEGWQRSLPIEPVGGSVASAADGRARVPAALGRNRGVPVARRRLVLCAWSDL